MKTKHLLSAALLFLIFGCQSEDPAKMYSKYELTGEEPFPKADFFAIDYTGDNFNDIYHLNKHMFKKVSSREECGDSFYFYDKKHKIYFKFIGKKGDIFIRPKKLKR
jgi:hypothetical protein